MMHSGILLPDVAWTAIDHAHSLNMTRGRNGVPIGIMEMASRKARGVKKGICDYLFWHRSLGFAIEMKIGDGKLDDDQKIFIRSLIAAQCDVAVCWTKVQLFRKLADWELLRPGVRLI